MIKWFKPYLFSLLLILAIVLGALSAYLFGEAVQCLKPLGDIFIRLMFTAMVPLIFFSIASAIAKTESLKKLSNLLLFMLAVFVFTGLAAALYALVVVYFFPPAFGIPLGLSTSLQIAPLNISHQWIDLFTVADFSQLWSHEHILAEIIFSSLVGSAVALSGDQGQGFNRFLQSGEKIFIRVFDLMMLYAPIGFFAYFAVMIHELGPQFIGTYFRVAILYYLSSMGYFFVAFTAFAYLAGKSGGVKLFWSHVFLPMITALATCSSVASIPAALAVSAKMGVPRFIADAVIPLGSLIHKDGSVIGGMFKIAFLFGLYHLDFSGPGPLLTAVGVSILVGVIMGAIPSGGMLGELFILSFYGFPPSALMSIAAISMIIDPLATMLNVTGNSISAMLIARWMEGKPVHSSVLH